MLTLRLQRGALLAACALMALSAPACNVQVEGDGEESSSEEGEDEDKFRPDPRTLVEVSQVSHGTVSDFLVSTGTVESEAEANLVPEAAGQVVQILAEEGDQVRRGQVLAVIRNVNLSAAFSRAEAELLRAEAELEKVIRLHEQGAVSDRDLSDAKYAVRTARASRDEAAGSQSNTQITSPIDGTVSVRDLRYGEVAGGQRAFQVVDLSRLKVVVRLPERDLADLSVGLPARLTSVYDEEHVVAGTVTRISPTVDPMTGTVRVTVELDSAQQVLRPGQYVSVRVEVGRHEDVLVIPRRALLYEEGDPVAFTVAIEDPPPKEEKEKSEEEKPRRRGFGKGMEEEEEEIELPGPYRIARKAELELGFVDEDHVEIVSGLDAGQEVVVTGHAALRDGARVRFPEDPRLGDEAGGEGSEKAGDKTGANTGDKVGDKAGDEAGEAAEAPEAAEAEAG
jgi:membrane fusion protein (multidrug efflux system)